MTHTQAASSRDFYLESFSKAQDLCAGEGGWLKGLRAQAIESFFVVGFPTTGQEEWKYTPTHTVTSVPFELSTAVSDPGYTIAHAGLNLQAAVRIVFVNGHYSKRLSSHNVVAEGIVNSLARAIEENSDLVKEYLGSHATGNQNGFSLLNTAFFHDGMFLHVPENAVLPEPIYLVFHWAPGDTKSVFYPRNLIVLGEGAKATVVECSFGKGNYFNNSISDVILGKRASLKHVKLQLEDQGAFHIASLTARQSAHSHFDSHYVSLGGRLIRNEIIVQLDDEYCNTRLNGLFLASNSQHVDNQTQIYHNKPHGTSRELYKGIIGDNATAVFNGKIYVGKNAQKTDAVQKNQNLLLSEEATINTKPHLEIYANDVKCTHGAGIGRLDEEAIFYLQSRGLPKETARKILAESFASEMIDQIGHIGPIGQICISGFELRIKEQVSLFLNGGEKCAD